MPSGVQIVTMPFDEATIFAAAAVIEGTCATRRPDRSRVDMRLVLTNSTRRSFNSDMSRSAECLLLARIFIMRRQVRSAASQRRCVDPAQARTARLMDGRVSTRFGHCSDHPRCSDLPEGFIANTWCPSSRAERDDLRGPRAVPPRPRLFTCRRPRRAGSRCNLAS